MEHDEHARRFSLSVDGKTAYVSYRRVDDGTLDFRRTFVPPSIRNRQVGRRLVAEAVAAAERSGFAIVPSCPFVAWVMESLPKRGGPR